jgi:hypothetical protein
MAGRQRNLAKFRGMRPVPPIGAALASSADVGVARPGGMARRVEKIGPYQLVEELVRSTSIAIWEARSPEDERVHLQITRLRAPRDEAERALRQKYERQIAGKTAGLIDEPEIGVRAHGGVDTQDGTRTLFWALPFRGHPLKRKLEAKELVTLAEALLARLERRHARGRFDPHLVFDLIFEIDDKGAKELAGVPVAVASDWLAQGFLQGPRTEEEERSGELSASGDLWRLGQALVELAADREKLPPQLAAWIAELPKSSAREAMSTLSSVKSAIEALPPPAVHGPPPLPPQTPPPLPISIRVAEKVEVSSELVDWGAAIDTPDRTPPPSAPLLRAPPLASLAEAELADRGPEPPPREGATLLRQPDLEPRQPEAPLPLPSGPEAVTRELRPKQVASPTTGELAAVDPSEARTSIDMFDLVTGGDPATEIEGAPAGLGPPPVATPAVQLIEVNEPDPKIDPLGPPPPAPPGTSAVLSAAWAAPVLPEGASPWSEVVKPRSAGRGEFPGFEGELPDIASDRVMAEKRITVPPPPAVGPPQPIRAEIAAAARGVSRLKIGMGAAAIFAVFGFFAFVAKNTPEPIEALEGLVATPANEVLLDSRPEHATVLAEADGRVLGETPLRFLVPQGADAVVLLAKKDFEPQRLVLPDRGGIVAELRPSSESGCEIFIDSDGAAIEGVMLDIGSGPRFAIPGAALVRVKDGDPSGVAGARIVHCPDAGASSPRLRFSTRRNSAAVRITHPPGANAQIDEQPLGPLPAAHRTRRSFSLVRVSEGEGQIVERWVPTMIEIEVQMPLAPPPIETALVEIPQPIVPDDVEPDEPEVEREGRPSSGGGKKARALELLKRGTQELIEGRTQRAREYLQGCLRVDPSVAECHRQLGQLYRRIEAREQAIEHFQRYLQLTPDAPDAPLVRRILREWN